MAPIARSGAVACIVDDQPEALGALLRLDAHHAERFTEPGGLWGRWVRALVRLRDHPSYTPDEQRRWTDLKCDFANGWARPRPPDCGYVKSAYAMYLPQARHLKR